MIDKYKLVDDMLVGGGVGMVLRVDVVVFVFDSVVDGWLVFVMIFWGKLFI